MPRPGITITAGELAERFGLDLRGDPSRAVRGVGTLAGAGPAQLSFLANSKYRSQLAETGAGLVVVRADDAGGLARDLLIAPDPYVAFAKIAALFEPPEPVEVGIHPSAFVHPQARVHAQASVGPHASIGARSQVAAGARIGPGCVIGEDCEVGAGSTLVARVTLVRRVRLGARVLVHPGAVLGADGFGLALDRGGDEPHWIKVPQLGGVRVGDDC